MTTATLERTDLAAAIPAHLTLDLEDRLAEHGPDYADFLRRCIASFRSHQDGRIPNAEWVLNEENRERNAGYVRAVYSDPYCRDRIQLSVTLPHDDQPLVDVVAPMWDPH